MGIELLGKMIPLNYCDQIIFIFLGTLFSAQLSCVYCLSIHECFYLGENITIKKSR